MRLESLPAICLFVLALAAAWCCKSSSAPAFEETRDVPSEVAIINELKISVYRSAAWYDSVRTVKVMNASDGTTRARIDTTLYPKKSNGWNAVAICAAVLGQRFNGKKLTSVEVYSDTWRMASSLSGRCQVSRALD